MTDYWTINKELLDHICVISRLSLSDKEKELYLKQLSQVLDVFKQLDKVKTDADPSFQPYKLENVWREDAVAETKWEPLSNAKRKEDSYFKGPRIV